MVGAVPARLSEREWSQFQTKYFKRGRWCVPSWYGRWHVVRPLAGVRYPIRKLKNMIGWNEGDRILSHNMCEGRRRPVILIIY